MAESAENLQALKTKLINVNKESPLNKYWHQPSVIEDQGSNTEDNDLEANLISSSSRINTNIQWHRLSSNQNIFARSAVTKVILFTMLCIVASVLFKNPSVMAGGMVISFCSMIGMSITNDKFLAEKHKSLRELLNNGEGQKNGTIYEIVNSYENGIDLENSAQSSERNLTSQIKKTINRIDSYNRYEYEKLVFEVLKKYNTSKFVTWSNRLIIGVNLAYSIVPPIAYKFGMMGNANVPFMLFMTGMFIANAFMPYGMYKGHYSIHLNKILKAQNLYFSSLKQEINFAIKNNIKTGVRVLVESNLSQNENVIVDRFMNNYILKMGKHTELRNMIYDKNHILNYLSGIERYRDTVNEIITLDDGEDSEIYFNGQFNQGLSDDDIETAEYIRFSNIVPIGSDVLNESPAAVNETGKNHRITRS